VAVGGILLANVLVFFGLFIIPPEQAAALSSAGRDAVALFIDKVLVEGKFYSISSRCSSASASVSSSPGAATPRCRASGVASVFSFPSVRCTRS
jgi:hypothetical protein